jgi:GDPmannose 4,6-dehydratase
VTRAVIVGSEGQDGRILFDRLASEGCSVLGLGRHSARSTEGDAVAALDVARRNDVADFIERWRPNEVYYLAAVHQSSQEALAADDAALMGRSLATHVVGASNFLQAIDEKQTGTHFFYAASSLIFGDPTESPQTERTPFRPQCVYGITKTAGVHACRYFRAAHAVHASVGILYNHESPLRRKHFVSQKIVRAAARISRGHDEKLVVGDLSAHVDWAYAPDVIDAMIRIVRQPIPDDYVVATGEAHSVQEFIEAAFGIVGLDWRAHVVENPNLLTRRTEARVGDSTKLRERTGWKPSVTFHQMVAILMNAALGEDVS